MLNDHLQLKSLANSKNEDGKTWTLMSLGIKRYYAKDIKKAIICFHRTIAYIDRNGEPEMIGKVYMPVSLRNLIFFWGLFFSGKTFGHYLKVRCGDEIKITLIEEEVCLKKSLKIWFATNDVKICFRKLEINNTKRFFYAEEIYSA